MEAKLLNKLNTLTDGLLWPSEADYPFEVFVWVDLAITPEQLRIKTGHSQDTAIETMAIDDFFCHCTTEQDWHNSEELAEVKRYQELASFLKENLEDVKVYKLGKCEIDVYIIGQCSSQFIGLQTKMIKT
jgi:hypothetical protein